MSGKEVVVGETVTVEFEGVRCIHSRHCVIDRPDVFVPNVEGAWIHPENASEAGMLEIAHNCPSGAIACHANDGRAMEEAPIVNTVRIHENGPLAFHGALSIADQADGFRRTLCRCGASRHKPYCDGSHHQIGFQASGEPATVDSEPLAVRNGPLGITPEHNGPLHVNGSVEILSGTGRTIIRTSETWLCRCGHSANKPFCDGSHTRVGFNSDG
ncbi:MAG: CDGSH iron-sulfur domain-containing protein [Pseudomonadota bacterium]|nr:CDGSH iron-sulfur domain-containing protein [Pseudomonadota bacterium]